MPEIPEISEFARFMCSCIDELKKTDIQNEDLYNELKIGFEYQDEELLGAIVHLITTKSEKNDQWYSLIPLLYKVIYYAKEKSDSDLEIRKKFDNQLNCIISSHYLQKAIEAEDAHLIRELFSHKRAKSNLLEHISLDYYLKIITNDNAEILETLFENDVGEKELHKRDSPFRKTKGGLTKLIIDSKAIKCIKVYCQYEFSGLNKLIGNIEEDNALLYAIRTGNTEIASYLIDSGMDLSFQNGYGETALHLAVKLNQPDLVKKLLTAGVSAHAKEKISQKTAFQYANEIKDKNARERMLSAFKENKAEDHPLMARLKEGSPFFKKMIERERKVTPDTKMFAHLNTGYTIGSTELEGESLTNTSEYYVDLLKRIPLPPNIDQKVIEQIVSNLMEIQSSSIEIKKALMNGIGFKQGHERNKIEIELVEKFKEKLLREKSLWLAGGYVNKHEPGHAMLYHLEIKDDTVYFKIYNTGDGVGNHSSKQGKYHAIKEFKFPLKKDENHSQLDSLLSNILYYQLDSYWDSKKINGEMLYSSLIGFKPNLYCFKKLFRPDEHAHKIKGDGIVFYRKRKEGPVYYCVIKDGKVVEKDIQIPEDSKIYFKDDYVPLDVETLEVDANNKVIDPHSVKTAYYAFNEINKRHNGRMGIFYAEEILPTSDHTLMTDQKGGNCTAKVLQSGLIKDMIPDEAQYQYVKLMLRLQSTVDYLASSIESGAVNNIEVQQEIEDGIKKTALLLNEMKDVFKLDKKEYLEILNGLEIISNELKDIKKQGLKLKQPSHEKFPEPAKLEFSKDHNNYVHISVRDMRGERKPIEPHEVKYIFDTKINHFSDIHLLKDFIDKQKKSNVPQHVIKQNIAEALRVLPYDLLRKYDYSKENSGDFWFLDDKDFIKQLEDVKSIIDIYNEDLEKNFSPKDTVVNEQLLFMLEHTKHMFEKRNHLPSMSGHASDILSISREAKSKELNISPSNSVFLEGVTHLLSDSDVMRNTMAFHLISSEVKKDEKLMGELEREALEYALEQARKNKLLEGKDLEKIKGVEDVEHPEVLACGYIAENFKKFEYKEPENKKQQNKDVFQLSTKDSYKINFFKNYYDSLKHLSQGLLMGEQSGGLFSSSRNAISNTLGLGFVYIKEDKKRDNKSLLSTSYPHVQSYQYNAPQKKINKALQYNKSKDFYAKEEDFLSDLNYEDYMSELVNPEANKVQVATATGSVKKEKVKLREVSHLRTQNELKFIKTVDYITKNMDKLLDPSYFRMIRICLLNANSLDVAKTTMPEAMMSFFELVSDSVKRYSNKEHVDEKAIKMISLFSVLANYIEKEDNPAFLKACDKTRSELVLLIESYNPEKKKFKSKIEEKQAHETMGALYQLWLISLGNKELLNDAELEMYIKAKIYLSKFPRKPDDPIHAKLLNVTAYKAVKAFSEMDKDKLAIMLENAGVSGAKNTKWRLAGGQLVDLNNRIFDVESGSVKKGTAEASVIPAKAFQNKSFTALLPDISVSHPGEMYAVHFKPTYVPEYDISCTEFEYQDETYRYTHTNEFQKRFKIKSPYDDWWELQSDPSRFMQNFPKVLWGADHDIWANCEKSHSLLISSNKGRDPKYFFDNGKLYRIKNNEMTDYVLLASDSPNSLFEPLECFENPDYCLIWQSNTQKPNIVVEMPRYNLTFTADTATKPLVLRCEAYPGYTLNLSKTNNVGVYFDNYLELVPDKDNKSQKSKILVPNQQFILPRTTNAKDKQRIKFKPLKLDVSSSILDAKNQQRELGTGYFKPEAEFKPIKHSPREHHYTSSQVLTEFELDKGCLISKSKGDMLQAIYLYIGNNDYKKAYELTEQYIKEGGFTGSPKEIRLMSWLLHDIPNNFYHPKDPRSAETALLKYTNPTLIAIKLKLLAQVSKFSNVGIQPHLTEGQKKQLKMPDWEFESINGTKGNKEALGVTELRMLSGKWLGLYNRQKNNIPIEMYLTSLEQVNLTNLNSPRIAEIVLQEKKPKIEKMELKVSVSKPKSILEHCGAIGVKFDFESMTETEVKIQDVFEVPDNATEFEKQLIEKENEDCRHAKKIQAQRKEYHQEISKNLRKNNNYLTLIDAVENENKKITLELKSEKETILKFANQALDRDENRLSQLSGQTKRITMADLNKLLVKGDLSEYQSLTQLSYEEINQLKQTHINHLAKKSQAKINKNFLGLCRKAKNSKRFEDFEEIIPELNKWYFKDRVYDIEKHPEFLIFEATQGLLIDEKQFHILSKLSKVENDVFTSMVTQLIMGGGKSKVLLPLLALLKAKGNNLSIIVVPDALLQTNFQDLASVAKSIFNQDIYRFSFTRQANYSEEQLLTKLNQLKIIRDNRSFIVMNKTSLEDLELKLAEMMKRKHPEDQKSIEIMKKMLSMFRNEGDALIDEIHLVHDIKIERNFTVADGTVKMKPEYIHSCLQFYDFLETIPYKDNKSLFDYVSGENASFTEEEITVLFPKIISELYNSQNSPLADFLRKHKTPEKQLEEFLTAKSHLLLLDDLPDEETQQLYVIKELISNLLPLNLRRNPLENYGPTKRPEELKHLEGSIVKPCRNVGKVNEDSKFSSPYETLDYTVLYSLKFGIQEPVFKAYLAKVKKAALQEHELSLNSIPITETEAAKVFESLTGISPEVLQFNLQDKDIAKLHQQCYKNPEFVLHCLEEHVLPLIDVDTLLLKHNAINHAFQFRSVQGFSGTIITPDIFDPRMEAFDYEFAKGTDGETISHVVAKQSPVENIKSENIDDILKQLILSITPKTSSIIDVGGILKGKDDVLDYVKPLAEHFKQNKERGTVSEDVKYILYFDEHDVLCAYPIYDQNPKVISIGSTDPAIIKDKLNIKDASEYFSVYFQDYTVGIDIKQISDGEGLVTVGNSTTLAKFLQGLMRMRGFALNQTIKIFVDKQAQDDMAQDDPKGTKKGNYDYQDVLNYTFKKQIQKIAEDNVTATRCMLRNVVRNQAVLLILASPENDYSKLEAFQSLLFDESPVEPSKLFRGFKKLENTESDFKLLKANLLKQFGELSTSVIQEKALKKMLKDLEEDMDKIIKKQVPKCQPETYTAASSNYDTQAISEKAVTQEKKSENKMEMERQQELENQNTGSLIKNEPLSYVPWPKNSLDLDWGEISKLSVEIHTDFKAPLFSKINDLLPQEKTGGNIFSDDLYASPNLLYSVKHQKSAPLDNLKKPVEFVFWMETEDKQYRAIMMTGAEFLELQKSKPDLKNAWIESVGGIQAMGKRPVKLPDNYYRLKTDVALYNCDLEYLILNRSLHAPLLEQSNEKLKFIRNHVLPLHSERMPTWSFFERFVDHLHTKKSLSQKEEVQTPQPVVFTDQSVKSKTSKQASKLSNNESQPPNRLTFTNLHAKKNKIHKPTNSTPPTNK